MTVRVPDRRSLAMALALAVTTALAGCGSDDSRTSGSTAATTAPAATAPAGTAAPAEAPVPVTANDVANQSWTPEALEDLLAPIALYPDPVLSQVLIASTNPQEVLDAGNWLVANETLEGPALDDAAARIGFTPPIRALIQFPQTVDMMCMEMGWTTELGQAFVADQAGVLDAVQRLRKQAIDVGNLKDSEAMTVATETQEGKEVVVLKPSKPEVVYVPTYDPQAVYAPPPAAPVAAAPATTTTTTEGHSTGSLITTGLLAFGAGILVNEVFDDDDDHHNGYYYPNYGYGGMPYYPPYPYRPQYGGGYYPSNGYNRPQNYNSGFQNNGTIVINNPGGNDGGYWNRYDNSPRAGSSQYQQKRNVSSPITQARPNRPELNELNQRPPRPMPADVKRPSPNATASNWKGQSTYAGKGNRTASAGAAPQDRINNASPKYSRPSASTGAGTRDAQRPPPKVQGSYAGKDRAQPRPDTRDATRAPTESRDMPKTQPVTRPSGGNGDRGYVATGNQRPASVDRKAPAQQHPTAMSGANKGGNDRTASQRGKQSLPQGARSKGGGGHKNRAR